MFIVLGKICGEYGNHKGIVSNIKAPLNSVLRVCFYVVSLHTIYKKCARVHALCVFLCVFKSFVENIDITKV